MGDIVKELKDLSGSDLQTGILKALADPSRYSFGDILALENIEKLSGDSTGKKWCELLKIFAHGTLSEYMAKRNILPELKTEHITKLKHLTILSLASQSKTLSYSPLVETLEAKTVEEVEDLITDCIRKRLIRGKHNPKAGVFIVEYSEGRDISDEDLDEMAQQMSSWLKTSQEALKVLKAKIQETKLYHANEKKRDQQLKEKSNQMKKMMEQKAGTSHQGRNRKRDDVNATSGSEYNIFPSRSSIR
eukprot:CAMPEP_0114523074 /NCGR_PEP_ID=MMETSP0109-20121206/21092_1 /TAXON_ID=29199 /ORGANISM="Chlorarachnion reptans, Strain CCCM449" /LENGTH=246 /DNA_ID=CAMNT_0001704355 /DNA_START=197 /DNA_END=937 /DNA_ORIENTATION=-